MHAVPIHTQFTAYLIGALLLGTLLLMWWGRVSFAQAGWRWGGWRTPILAWGWGGLLAIAGVSWLRFLLQTHRYLPLPVPVTTLDWVVLILLMPLAEELFFRGAVFVRLQRSWHPFWAVILSAIFATLCLSMQLWLGFVFLTGIGYTLAFRAAGSVLAPIGAHILVAAVLLLARTRPDAVIALPAETLLIGCGVALLMILVGSVGVKGNSG